MFQRIQTKAIKAMVLCLLGTICVLSGCSSSKPSVNQTQPDKSNGSSSQSATKQQTETPTDLDGILSFDGQGTYAGNSYDQETVNKQLQQIPKNASDSQIYSYLLQLVGENYKSFKQTYDSFDPKFQEDLKTILPDPKQPGSHMNVEVILDCSGSMAESVSGGVKMALAKNSIQEFLAQLPKGTKIGLRVFGEKGTSADADKQLSCSTSELVYKLSPYDQGSFNQALNQFKPSGWTAIAASLEAAQKDLEQQQQLDAQNVIYLVTDGIETCGGDPVERAKEVQQSNTHAVINVIGFNVDNAAQFQLQSAAHAGGGTYFSVKDAQSLNQTFKQQQEQLRKLNNKWLQDALKRLNKNFGSYRTELNTNFQSLQATINKEHENLMEAYDFLKTNQLIHVNNRVQDMISHRMQILTDYNTKELQLVSNEIQGQANWDELEKQFHENESQINSSQ